MYLIVDGVAVVGLFLGWTIGFFAFYLAAVSQMILYTGFRGWIVDVPPEFVVTDAQQAYLTTLVLFHAVTLVLVTAVSWRYDPRAVRTQGRPPG